MTDHRVPTVGLIHAVQPAIPPLREQFARDLPNVRTLNLLDEALIAEMERLGSITPALVRRMTDLVELHQKAGASLVLLSCTVYSPFIDQVQAQSDVPVLAIDSVMVDQAVGAGRRLGVLATNPNGLKMQREMLARASERLDRPIEIEAVLRTDAWDALVAGQGERHDAILAEEAALLAPSVDVLVLAQASMARALPRLPTDLPVAVLSSPSLAVQKVKEVLAL
jgi:Asp/Glu/hydantoin racemase